MGLTVSAIIPVHNGERTLERAVDSIFAQVRPVDEIIIVDDHSTDSTREVVAGLQGRSPVPIRLISTDTNSGPGVARNLAWDHAASDIIAFLDADDLWHPRKIEIQMSLMESSESTVMSCHERTVGEWLGWQELDTQRQAIRRFSLKHFLTKNRCSTPSVMLRRSISERFSDEIRFAEDYHLWLKVAAHHGPVSFIDLALTHCSNPAYGGSGLSGRMIPMYKGETLVWQLLRRERMLTYPQSILLIAWSTLKFAVRVLDNRVLRNRIQTVSESR